jgi:hypothetical protein
MLSMPMAFSAHYCMCFAEKSAFSNATMKHKDPDALDMQ